VAIADDDSVVAMTNPDGGSISIFLTSNTSRLATVATGLEPSAVVIHPDNVTAFVANRADATVVKVTGINTSTPLVAATVAVGAEPTGLALSPTGATLFVAEWGEGRVAAIDTATMNIVATIETPQNPRTLAVTNDGDNDDSDELLLVPEYFGEPTADGCPNGTAEVCDIGRSGRVRIYETGTLTPVTPIVFNPIDSGFAPAGSSEGTPMVMTSPNQLGAVAVHGDKIYVASVSASPQAPINFRANVFPVVYVGNVSSRDQDGSTANLAKLATDLLGDNAGTDRFFLGDLADLAFDGDSSVAYVVSRAADVIQRVDYGSAGSPSLGTAAVAQINVSPACQNPIGIVVDNSGMRAYVNCWITRRLGVIDIASQTLETAVQSTDLPIAGTGADSVRKGARFYFTGRGRWSDEGEGYSSCGSCHPDGLSDNITWSFGAGPRQTTSMDASFSKGGSPLQRVFNWSGIFDEVHDFERNTRGVSGGLGAITTSSTNQCGTPALEQQVAVTADGLGQPLKEVQDTTAGICVKDWEDINEFVKTIRPPRGRRTLDADSVARGAALFGAGEGNCTTCHAGPNWTVSRRFWTPSSAANAALKATPFVPPTGDSFWPPQALQIAPQPAAADNTGAAIGPNQVACVLRNVNTFGVPGNDTTTDALERKADGTRAQGRGGFNVPSLWGLSVGAPFFHHGQAASLVNLLTDSKWAGHLHAGNANFEPTADQSQDLINFLLSIDPQTSPLPIPATSDACPVELSATLSGAAETANVTTDASGNAKVILSNGDVLVVLNTLNLTDVLVAHIHAGLPGADGPVVFGLYDSMVDPLFSSPFTRRVSEADFVASPEVGINTFADVLAAIRSGNAYLNVHTTANPGGEIRGQVE
jgi:YVTN family beta-propeller protein